MKLYPAGATTNSANGVTIIEGTYPVLRTMAELQMPLLVHCEITDPVGFAKYTMVMVPDIDIKFSYESYRKRICLSENVCLLTAIFDQCLRPSQT